MKVSDLIAMLQKFPQDVEVRAWNADADDYASVVGSVFQGDLKTLELTTESGEDVSCGGGDGGVGSRSSTVGSYAGSTSRCSSIGTGTGATGAASNGISHPINVVTPTHHFRCLANSALYLWGRELLPFSRQRLAETLDEAFATATSICPSIPFAEVIGIIDRRIGDLARQKFEPNYEYDFCIAASNELVALAEELEDRMKPWSWQEVALQTHHAEREGWVLAVWPKNGQWRWEVFDPSDIDEPKTVGWHDDFAAAKRSAEESAMAQRLANR